MLAVTVGAKDNSSYSKRPCAFSDPIDRRLLPVACRGLFRRATLRTSFFAGGNSTKSRRLFILSTSLLAAGCVSYEARPLDEHEILREIQQIRLDALAPAAVESVAPQSPHAFDPTNGLSPDEAVAVALFLNPGLRAVRRERGVAEGELVTAGLLPNPELTASWLHIQDFTRSFATGLIDVGVNWSLPRPGEIDAKQTLARSRIGQVVAEVSDAEWKIAAEVRKDHFAVRTAAEQLKLAEGILRLQEKVRTFIRDKRALGDATDLDASLADVEYVSALQERELATGALEKSRQRLNAVLGLPPLAEITLEPGDDLPAFDATTFTPEILESWMLGHRPGIAALRSQYEQAEQKLRLACLESWPWFRFGAAYERDAGDATKSINKIGGNTGLELPFFNFNQGEIASREAERDRLREAFRAEVHEGRAELNEALRALRALDRVIRLHRDAVRPALDENLRLTETGIAGGLFNLLQLTATQNTALKARKEFLTATLDYASAWFDLEQALGSRLSEVAPGKD